MSGLRCQVSEVSCYTLAKSLIARAAHTFDKVYKIKIPKGTTIYDGPVGSQGGIYQGGLNKEQIFIDSPWNLDGVEVIDSWPIIH